MSQDTKNLQLLQKVITEGDQWLLEHGVVSDLSHNTIVYNLYDAYPQVLYLDYVMDKDNKIIDLTVYVSTFRLIFMTVFGRRDKFLNQIFLAVKGYLKDFQVRVKLRRFKEEHKLKSLESQEKISLDEQSKI